MKAPHARWYAGLFVCVDCMDFMDRMDRMSLNPKPYTLYPKPYLLSSVIGVSATFLNSTSEPSACRAICPFDALQSNP